MVDEDTSQNVAPVKKENQADGTNEIKLQEIGNTPNNNKSNDQPNNSQNSNTSNNTQQQKDPQLVKQDMARIIAELKQKMNEIDVITKELEEKRQELDKNSPQKTKRLLEELKVPPLEMLQ